VGDSSARTLCGGDPFSCSTGAVHVYERFEGNLVFRQTIVPPDVRLGDNFGASLDVDGDRLVVGAFKSRWPDSSQARGAVFVYGFDGEEWVEQSRVPAPPEVSTGFGTNVVLHGQDMVIWPNLGPDQVYVYRLAGGQWSRIETLRPEPGASNWRFGKSMHLDDQWLFVGAPYDNTITPSGGSVYVYQRGANGSYTFQQRLRSDQIARFGHAVAHNGHALLIGAPLASPTDENQGVVDVFALEGDAWVFSQRLTHTGAMEGHTLGSQISASGRRLLAATTRERTPEGISSVYAFEQGAEGAWHETGRLVANPPEHVGQLGFSMAIDDGLALVASLDEPGGGAAYFFDIACTDCPPDLDADGALTIFDFLTYLNLFQDGDPLADFDGDGELTVFDFLAFGTAFDAGC
jgi:hypothetical protein